MPIRASGKLKAVIVLALILASGATGIYWLKQQDKKPAQFKTETAERGEIIQSISANGTLNPVVLVNVGTQVSGTVKKLHADFNDRVKTGQVLAELDPSLFEAQERQDRANLMGAQASLQLAQIKLTQQRRLHEKGFASDVDFEQAQQAVAAARAQVKVAEAQLQRDRTNLRYTVIQSPISGVVVARNVDIGQTVAASFQTPTLFQIAQDLRKMQIDTSVAEADVGNVHVGQSVRFTVDAFPSRDFDGTVSQIRLNPTIQQNVVTYNVVVAVDNADGTLLPGMTAHVHITVARKEDVLRVPNAALRFQPKGQSNAAPAKTKGPGVYIVGKDGKAVPVKVQTGITDNTYTEITGGDLRPGAQVVIRQLSNGEGKDQSNFRFRAF